MKEMPREQWEFIEGGKDRVVHSATVQNHLQMIIRYFSFEEKSIKIKFENYTFGGTK